MLYSEKIISKNVFLACRLLISENSQIFSILFDTGFFEKFNDQIHLNDHEIERPLSNIFFI